MIFNKKISKNAFISPAFPHEISSFVHELHVSRIPEEPNIRAIYMQFVVCCHSADILYKEWIYFVYMYLF